MGTTRFKGETASERLNFESISDSDMIQIRHLPGTLNDADKGISKAQLMSCPFGVCDTAANTALKTVSLADSNPDFVLVSGREVVIYFANANTETSPVINFEGSGSYPLFFDNGSPVGTWAAGTWMHLKFFSVEINDTLIQRWILLSPLPIDAVTANNMQSVTSNAVAEALENKQTINPATSLNLPNVNEEINFYKLTFSTTSIEGVKSALITYGFQNIRSGTSFIELVGPGGQRYTVILSHSGTAYFGGIIITFYYPITYIQYSNGTWN